MWSPRILVLAFLLIPAAALAADKPFGLKQRIPWNDSPVVGSPDPLPPYKVVRPYPNLSVKQPLVLTPEPGTNRLLILQHLGTWAGPSRLLAVPDRQDVTAAEAAMLIEIKGLAIGFALHPDYQRNGYIYFGLNGPGGAGRKTTQVVRYTISRQALHGIDPASKSLIIEWPSNGHDGGDLAFGNDGFLYVSSGDGSSGSDAHMTGQAIDDLLASVLRIDVDHPDPGRNYSVPKDNPFVDRKGPGPSSGPRPAQPLALSYDRESGQLWVGQNGQELWEQVYLIKKGGNYGWSITEGSHIFVARRRPAPTRSCRRPPNTPTARRARSPAAGSTGHRLPDLVGAYLYGDWSTGRVWGIKHDGTKAVWHRELVDTPFNITGFGTDHAGELYVIDQVTGFYRLDPTTEADQPKQPFPTKLSETGLFESVASHKPHPAAIKFDVNAPQWADGATMERFVVLPGLEKIVQKPQLNAGGSWSLPNGSVLVQTLSLDAVEAPASRPASESRRAFWFASKASGPVIPTDGMPSRPTATWCRLGRHRGVRGARPGRAGRPSRAGLAVPFPGPSAWSATRGPSASTRPSIPSSSTATTITAASPTTSSAARAHRCVRGQAAHQAGRPDQLVNPYEARPRWRPESNRTCTSIARPATSMRAAATRAWSWVSTLRSAA